MAHSNRKWTDEDLSRAVAENDSVADVLRAIGLVPAGGNYVHIQFHMRRLGLSTDHHTGKIWNKGGVELRSRRSVIGAKRPNSQFRNRLIRDGYFEHRCSMCGLDIWLGEPIPLELDHIDGDRYNNELDNFRMLCPNCHAKTPTYRGKNIGKVPYKAMISVSAKQDTRG